MTFKGAELNYPVHEKEMLAVIRVLKRWRSDLIRTPFLIYTDHKTLENFEKQKKLSRQQVRWMEFLSQYDGKIIYVKGEDNMVADVLSRLPELVTTSTTSSEADMAASPVFHIVSIGDPVASVLKTPEIFLIMIAATLASMPVAASTPGPESSRTTVQPDEQLLSDIREGYNNDPFIHSLQQASPGMSNIKNHNGFWFIGNQLIISNVLVEWDTISAQSQCELNAHKRVMCISCTCGKMWNIVECSRTSINSVKRPH